jgi:hypothetical protein
LPEQFWPISPFVYGICGSVKIDQNTILTECNFGSASKYKSGSSHREKQGLLEIENKPNMLGLLVT